MKKKIAILFTFIVVTLSLFFTGSIHAEETEETVPTSTIGSINGPADVGVSTTIVVEECYDMGDGTGQTKIGLLPCVPESVDVGEPPIPLYALPETGGSWYILFVSIWFVVMGFFIVRISRGSK